MDSMDIDDPNNAPDPNAPYYHIIRMFGTGIDNALNGDDHMLDLVLLELAGAVPDRTVDISSFLTTIEALHMNDLRDHVKSRNYDKAAREVLRRCLAAKQKPVPSLPAADGGPILDAFAGTYIGDSTTVQKAIEQVIGDTNLYANAIPFVQSSGTGKSRLMVELGQHFFVLMLNLREEDSPGNYSYPEPDCDVRTYLQVMEPASKDDITPQEHWRLRYAAFLCALFDVLSIVVTEGAFTPPQLAQCLEARRSELLDNIIKSSRVTEAGFIERYRNRAKPKETCGQVTWDSLRRSAEKFFEQTRRHHLTQQPAYPPPLVLALDEAHVMAQHGASMLESLLDIFCSVMADMKAVYSGWKQNMHFTCIFLSTNSELNNVTPTVGQISSKHMSSLMLAGALTCVPFDVFVEQDRSWTVSEISTLDFLGSFGPLMNAGLADDRALSLAQEKLAHAKRPFAVNDLMGKQTAFALLARRILLHFRPLQSSTTTMASNLVARHLQVAYVVPTHRTFILSGSPSEPFLVEAAARMMATPGFNTIDCLLQFTNEELLDPGESGEIVGCTLMINAYDAAMRARVPTMYHSWVHVLDFLKALFPDDVYKRVISITPFKQPNGPTLGAAFASAVVRLTHFVRLSELNLITAANVRKAFLRGMGIVGAQSQQLIDILIPMLFVDSSKEPSEWVVEEGAMSQIMANWKNEAADATPPHSDPYDAYPELNTEQPTILMWHQFGSKKNIVDLPQAERLHHPGRAVYFIDVYGIAPEVYKSITVANVAKYQQVVGCADMYRDAPYTYHEYIADVERTLPRWSTESFKQTAG
ncbi:hypothetical protein BDZ89DRAFT_1077772 [Hymenopellis radicata]|nr:hypothetical protein BDZ89DRAFT_1077772 [Hymenopellis radicata]